MSFIDTRTNTPRIQTTTCRRCGLEIWHLAGDDMWLCDADPGLYCPDASREPAYHSPHYAGRG